MSAEESWNTESIFNLTHLFVSKHLWNTSNKNTATSKHVEIYFEWNTSTIWKQKKH